MRWSALLSAGGRLGILTSSLIQFHHQEGLDPIVGVCFSSLPRSFFGIPRKSRYVISGEMLRFHRSAATIDRSPFSNKKRVGCSSTLARFFATACAYPNNQESGTVPKFRRNMSIISAYASILPLIVLFPTYMRAPASLVSR